MTQPSVDTPQTGAAADAVRTLQAGLRNDYSEIRSAEVQLAEAILSAHAVTVSGRTALQDIQRQVIEAINNPVAALDTPAGERGFLLFLRTKITEIQDIVETGALTDEDHARLTRALGCGYLLPASERGGDVRLPRRPAAHRRALRRGHAARCRLGAGGVTPGGPGRGSSAVLFADEGFGNAFHTSSKSVS